MADAIVNQFQVLINQQVKSNELLREQLYKARALAQVANHDNFSRNTKAIINDYLSTLEDLIQQAIDVNDGSLDALLRHPLGCGN